MTDEHDTDGGTPSPHGDPLADLMAKLEESEAARAHLTSELETTRRTLESTRRTLRAERRHTSHILRTLMRADAADEMLGHVAAFERRAEELTGLMRQTIAIFGPSADTEGAGAERTADDPPDGSAPEGTNGAGGASAAPSAPDFQRDIVMRTANMPWMERFIALVRVVHSRAVAMDTVLFEVRCGDKRKRPGRMVRAARETNECIVTAARFMLDPGRYASDMSDAYRTLRHHVRSLREQATAIDRLRHALGTQDLEMIRANAARLFDAAGALGAFLIPADEPGDHTPHAAVVQLGTEVLGALEPAASDADERALLEEAVRQVSMMPERRPPAAAEVPAAGMPQGSARVQTAERLLAVARGYTLTGDERNVVLDLALELEKVADDAFDPPVVAARITHVLDSCPTMHADPKERLEALAADLCTPKPDGARKSVADVVREADEKCEALRTAVLRDLRALTAAHHVSTRLWEAIQVLIGKIGEQTGATFEPFSAARALGNIVNHIVLTSNSDVDAVVGPQLQRIVHLLRELALTSGDVRTDAPPGAEDAPKEAHPAEGAP